MPSTFKKRKASAPLGSEGRSKRPTSALRKDAAAVGSSTTTPRIPPPVWGHVMDYMPYGEVRSFLLVSKSMAADAASYVGTLNITDSSQLDVPSAWRFRENAENINILCLLEYTRDIIPLDYVGPLPHNTWFELSEDAMTRIVPFLSAFSSIERVFVGGLSKTSHFPNTGVKFYYHRSACGGPSNHPALFRSLISNFLGAFRSRSLPKSLKRLDGIKDSFRETLNCEDESDPCEFCSRICQYFPTRNLIDMAYEYFEDEPLEPELCLSQSQIFHLLKKRADWTDCVKEIGPDILIQFVASYMASFQFFEFEDEDEKDSVLRRKLIKAGVALDDSFEGIQYFGFDDLEALDRYIELGFDPNKVKKRELYDALHISDAGRRHDVLVEATFDILKSRDFPVDKNDFILVDHTTEKDLEDFSDIIANCEKFPYVWEYTNT